MLSFFKILLFFKCPIFFLPFMHMSTYFQANRNLHRIVVTAVWDREIEKQGLWLRGNVTGKRCCKARKGWIQDV